MDQVSETIQEISFICRMKLADPTRQVILEKQANIRIASPRRSPLRIVLCMQQKTNILDRSRGKQETVACDPV